MPGMLATDREPGRQYMRRDEDLRGWELPTQRIDEVFVRNDVGVMPDDLGSIFARVVGDTPKTLTKSRLWRSDHAAVVGHLKFPIPGNSASPPLPHH